MVNTENPAVGQGRALDEELLKARDAVLSVILEVFGHDSPNVKASVDLLKNQNPKSAQFQQGMSHLIQETMARNTLPPQQRVRLEEVVNAFSTVNGEFLRQYYAPNAQAYLETQPSRVNHQVLARQRDLIAENMYEAYFKHDPELQRIHKELFGETNMIREAIDRSRGVSVAERERRIGLAVQKETARIEFAVAVLEKATELGGPSPETIKQAYGILKEKANEYGFYGQWLNRDYQSFYVSEKQLDSYRRFREEVLNKHQPIPAGEDLQKMYNQIISLSGSVRHGATDVRWFNNHHAQTPDFRSSDAQPKYIPEPRISSPQPQEAAGVNQIATGQLATALITMRDELKKIGYDFDFPPEYSLSLQNAANGILLTTQDTANIRQAMELMIQGVFARPKDPEHKKVFESWEHYLRAKFGETCIPHNT